MSDLRNRYESEIHELAEASRRLGELGYVTSHGGNLSYRVAEDVVLITPTKVVKRRITADDIVAVNMAGETLFASPGRRPTGETPMHTRLFGLRPDLTGLVHAHPPVLTGFSMSGSDVLARPLLPEVVIEVGPVLRVPYAEPISDALAVEFDRVVAGSNAWLMENHGVMIGSAQGISRALDLLEMTEAMARSVEVALNVGELTEIPRRELENLERTIRTRQMPRPGDPAAIDSLADMYFS
jgi:L-fuculose-phosphate aldolase